VIERLRAAQSALVPRARELREADDWRRFANATIRARFPSRLLSIIPVIVSYEPDTVPSR